MKYTDPDSARIIVGSYLRADDEHRRDHGAFGADDRRTIHQANKLWHAKQHLRRWYVANYGADALMTPPERQIEK